MSRMVDELDEVIKEWMGEQNYDPVVDFLTRELQYRCQNFYCEPDQYDVDCILGELADVANFCMMMAVKYPGTRKSDHTKTWYFDDLCDATRDAILQAYRVQRRKRCKGVKWEGPSLTSLSLLVGGLSIEEALSEEMLKYDEENQGRDPLDVIIGVAIRLGIEQGFRMIADREMSHWQLMLNSVRRYLKNPNEDYRADALEDLDSLERLVLSAGGLGYTEQGDVDEG